MLNNIKEANCKREYKDNKYNIVFFWKQNDTGIYGRRQDMFIKYLSQSPVVNKIFHFDAPVEIGTLISFIDLSRERKYSQSNLIFLQTIYRMMGLKRSKNINYYTFVYTSNKFNRLFARWLLPMKEDYFSYLKTVLERNKVWERRTIFWVCPKNFDFPKIASMFNPNLIVADVIDDHRAWFEHDSPEVAKLTENYKDILGLSDIVLTNCKNVSNTMSTYSDNIYMVSNACELPVINDNHHDMPRDLGKIKKPIIGYVGNLSTRIDIPLLKYITTKRPDWNIVLIGSAHLSKEILELNSYKNIHFLGVKKYSIVRQYISNFDVAIIPHINNELTQSMNPLKLFVYCSMNIPVVSTAINNLDELLELVYVARDKQEFLEKIEFALAKKKNSRLSEEQIALLKKNSWVERVEQVLSLISKKID